MKLYGFPRSRSTRVLWALEECGLDYEYVHVDFASGAGRQPPFIDINPYGKVPALVHEDGVLTESAAIVSFLGKKVPEAGFVPEEGTRARALYDQWCFFVIGELEQPLWTLGKHRFALPKKWRVPEIKETALWEFKNAAKVLAKGLDGRDFLVGDQFSFADLMVAHTLSWARSFKVPFPDESLDAYADRILSRPALERARSIEKP